MNRRIVMAIIWIGLCLVAGTIFAVTPTIGGSIVVILGTSSTGFYMLLGTILACSVLGIWSFMRNIVYKGKAHAFASFWIILGCIVACVYVAGLFASGIENVIDAFLNRLDHLSG
jgi:hypothetical protein